MCFESYAPSMITSNSSDMSSSHISVYSCQSNLPYEGSSSCKSFRFFRCRCFKTNVQTITPPTAKAIANSTIPIMISKRGGGGRVGLMRLGGGLGAGHSFASVVLPVEESKQKV